MIRLAFLLSLSICVAYRCGKISHSALEMCLCNITAAQYEIDCSNANLSNVPRWIPLQSTHLDLDNNHILVFKKDSFPELRKYLRFISLKNNHIKKLELGVFDNVPNLQELNLYNNYLDQKNSLPELIFGPLRNSLKVLDVRQNYNTKEILYPRSIGKLESLLELRMDYVKAGVLPAVYSKMKNLTTLILQGKEQGVSYLKNETFVSISKSNIREIYLEGLHLGRIGTHAFSKLKLLRKLDLSNNPELGFRLADIASSLQHSSMRVLNLNNVGLVNSIKTATNILSLFCSLPLEELTLESNYLHADDLRPIISQCFPKLKILSLSNNYLFGGLYLVNDILKLKNLIGFNISNQMPLPSHRVRSDGHYSSIVKRHTHICQTGMACPFTLPSTLQWVDISHDGVQSENLPEIVFMRNTSLKKLYASYAGLQTMVYPVYCPKGSWDIIPNIDFIDVSNNKLQCINSSFFDKKVSGCDWASLEYLYLNNNELGNIEGNICNNLFTFLEPLINLKVLNIANNQIKSTSKLTSLQKLKNLEEVNLSSNQFNNFSLELKDMEKLVKINLANNNLKCLSTSTTIQLDQMKSDRPALSLDLSGNLLSCNCECYRFFKWMVSTDIDLEQNETYQCEFNDGERISLKRLSYIVSKLETHCFGTYWFKRYVAILGTIYIFIVISSVMYRLRHSIWFWHMQTKIKRQRLSSLLNKNKYTFNAFVSCDHRDAKLFVKRKMLSILEGKEKLKLCIAQRDFVVGATIIDNIIRAMNRSRRIIFIISQYFLESKWCKEELKIAQQVSLERGQNIIICIFMPNVKQKKLPATIRMITKTVTCLKWCPNPKVQDVFWLKLHAGLLDGDMEDDHSGII